VTQNLLVASDRVGPAKPPRGYRAGLRRRVRRVQREARRAPGRVTQMLHKLPISPHIRHELARVVLWSPGSSQIAIDDALLGGQNGLSAAEYAAATGDLFWPSRRVVDGPHAELLRRSRNAGELSDEEILDSPYGQMAARSIDVSGQYFSATDFIDRTFSDDPGATTTRARQSRAGTPILVAPIAHSDMYQVVDGHHRIASLAIQGRETFPARVRRSRVRTPVQDLLEEMSWIGGNQELYQPIDAPELERDWATVRRCTDRLGAMDQVTARLGIEPDTSSYLDVASCYGWFVAKMRDRGFDAYGIERDPLAPSLGVGAYGLDPNRISVGDAVELLTANQRRYDVVSCFSLLHHFVLGRGSTDAEGLLELLDQATGRVLFLDTGQANEAWFKESLPEWDPPFIAKFLEKNSTFDEIIDWGPDADAVPPYQDNYGRHLFACIRMST